MGDRLFHAELPEVAFEVLLQEVGRPLVVADLLFQREVSVAADQNPALSPNTEADGLEKVLPEVRALAQKVGGYGKLADLARQLEQGGE